MIPYPAGASGGNRSQPPYGVQAAARVRAAPARSSSGASPSRSIAGTALDWIWCVQTTL